MKLLLILLLVALALVVPGRAEGASRFCSSLTDRPVVVTTACQQIPALRTSKVSDTQATTLLRHWATSWIDVAGSPASFDSTVYTHTSIDGMYEAYRVDQGGMWCWGTAVTLAKLYHAFGFQSWAYNYGVRKYEATHVVTLVKVGGKVIVQDAYMNQLLVDKKGRPLDVRQALKMLRAGHPRSLRSAALPTRRDVLYTPSAYLQALVGELWLGNIWPDGNRHNMRSCAPSGPWIKCSIILDHARALRGWWHGIAFAYPSFMRSLRGNTANEKLVYLMGSPLSLWSPVTLTFAELGAPVENNTMSRLLAELERA